MIIATTGVLMSHPLDFITLVMVVVLLIGTIRIAVAYTRGCRPRRRK
jgi:hypothetical protein